MNCGTCHDRKTICGVSTHVIHPHQCEEKLHAVKCPYCYVEIRVMRRSEIEKLESFDGPAIAICIAYPDGRLHRVHAGGAVLDVLHLRFHDCDEDGTARFAGRDPGAPPKGKGVPMTREQAREVIAFLLKHPGVKYIYIACYGGVSRSRGIGCAIAKMLGQDDSEIRGRGKDIDINKDPNPWCERLVLEAGDEA